METTIDILYCACGHPEGSNRDECERCRLIARIAELEAKPKKAPRPGPTFTDRDTKSVTFQGKLSLPIHRWYRLTPSFSPQLADDIADHFKLDKSSFVLDPFSGVGTVPLCMKYRGIPACSVEINPYLHFVGTVKTRTYKDLSSLEAYFKTFVKSYRSALRRVDLTQSKVYLEKFAEFIPPINFPERWWSPGNLAQLVCLRKLLMSGDKASGVDHDLLRMGILSILIPVSNAKHNHVSLTYAAEPLQTVDVAAVLETQLSNIVADLKAVSDKPSSEVVVHYGNSKELSKVLPKDRKVTAIITSPPYPNRFSYARETRPHLFFFDFIENATAVGQLETDAIGGTWGKATSVLSKGVAPKNNVIERLLRPFLGNVDTKGDLMASYVTKYFNDLYDHAEEVSKVCAKRAKLAYVIGNSKFFDNPLPSDEILGSIFGHFGFSLDRIDRMRKRQSKSGLYEAVVFMERK